jgi:hypothetical protein
MFSSPFFNRTNIPPPPHNQGSNPPQPQSVMRSTTPPIDIPRNGITQDSNALPFHLPFNNNPNAQSLLRITPPPHHNRGTSVLSVQSSSSFIFGRMDDHSILSFQANLPSHSTPHYEGYGEPQHKFNSGQSSSLTTDGQYNQEFSRVSPFETPSDSKRTMQFDTNNLDNQTTSQQGNASKNGFQLKRHQHGGVERGELHEF